MKKHLTIAIALMALAMIGVSSNVYAGAGCSASQAKVCTGHMKAGTTGDMKACTPEQMKACAAQCGLTPDECKQYCSSDNYRTINMSIDGMTCTGCENTVSACLEAVPGVVKVGKVDHKAGTAFVIVDAKKGSDESLVTAVKSKGYQAQITNAVAKTTEVSAHKDAVKGCGVSAKACSPSCAAAATCGAKTSKTNAQTIKSESKDIH